MDNKEIKLKYRHNDQLHNLGAPKEIIPILMDLFNPESVVDIGCGIGNFLYCFKKAGVVDVLGIDGEWVIKNKMAKYLQKSEFLEKDLEKTISLERKYDLVLCLEVAEHLSERRAEKFVQDLILMGNIIVFSAAIPFQGGQNHLNEQWLTYWEKYFNDFDFVLHDILRPVLWENQNIPWWYRQNVVVFAHKSIPISQPSQSKSLRNIVHPELLIAKNVKNKEVLVQLNCLKKGKGSSLEYFKLLIKSFFN